MPGILETEFDSDKAPRDWGSGKTPTPAMKRQEGERGTRKRVWRKETREGFEWAISKEAAP